MEDRVSPFSRKSLEALAEVLETHGAMLAIDPVSNALGIRELPEKRVEQDSLQQ